jgi:transcription initiation factor TFIIB
MAAKSKRAKESRNTGKKVTKGSTKAKEKSAALQRASSQGPARKLVLKDNKLNIESVTSAGTAGGGFDIVSRQPMPSRLPQTGGQQSEARVQGRLQKCPSCSSTDLIFDNEKGELVCNSCGLVIEENVTDTGPEWRAFDADQRNARARTGAPIKYTKPNRGLVTEIDLYNKDIRGVRIPSKRQAQLYRMRKWHKRASIASSSERNYLIALPELNRVASYLGLPDNIRESAALLYRKCVQNNLIRGRPIETVVQAVIYAACRSAGMPRTLDEISSISGLPKKEIGRAYRVISHELGLKIPLTDPISYVPRYVNALKLSGEAQEKSVALLKDAMKKGLVSGRSPTGVSAAAVYIAGALAGERRTQKEVADVAGVTEVTIRNRYRELKEQLNIDVNL